MKYLPKVYTASKIHHAALWLKLADPSWIPDLGQGNWHHVEFTARWPRMAHLEEGRDVTPTAGDFRHFWNIDKTDVMRSDFVLLYAGDVTNGRMRNGWNFGQDSDSLRGGLVEAGIAIGANKTVVTVGLAVGHSWAHSACVIKLPTLEEARNFFFRYHI